MDWIVAIEAGDTEFARRERSTGGYTYIHKSGLAWKSVDSYLTKIKNVDGRVTSYDNWETVTSHDLHIGELQLEIATHPALPTFAPKITRQVKHGLIAAFMSWHQEYKTLNDLILNLQSANFDDPELLPLFARIERQLKVVKDML